jgi:hypothetical protein
MASVKKKKDKRVEKEYWEEIELTDPNTGKKIKQRIKVIKYKTVSTYKPIGNKGIVEELYDGEHDIDDDFTDEKI